MTRLLLAVSLAALVGTSTASGSRDGRGDDCRPLGLGPGYSDRVESALRAGQDVWGNALLRHRDGPTYESVRRYLAPLLLANGPGRARLTESGVHYVAFMESSGPEGSGSAALHVADGSQVVSQRARGQTLTIAVGRDGRERYGSCRSRLAVPRLAGGYLPILQTRYVDAAGVRYTQESFATRIAGSSALVSFVRVTADARRGRGVGGVRFVPSAEAERPLASALPARAMMTTQVAWSSARSPDSLQPVDRVAYDMARDSVLRNWRSRLSEGVTIDVPERRVRDAARNLLVQNLGLSWRNSVGNAYQQFSFPEGIDVAEVMSAYGFPETSSAILRRSLLAPRAPYPNWRAGQKLVAAALYFRLFRDASLITKLTPELRRAVASLRRQVSSSGESGLLQRERYSSDVPDLVHGLHSQAVAWQGLREMSHVWSATGDEVLAARSRDIASRLEAGLRRAVRTSSQRLPDGSVFVPVRLLDDERPYGSVTETRAGSYWNLVVPYALASGLFAPRSRDAEGVLRYMLAHGSRMLGLVRAGAYSLYGRHATHPTSGVNPVYGLNVARFLADNDRPDQLVLSLYGQLAAGMAPGTFVSGEAASVTPLPRERYRAMYLPPNGASNASFLETLRLMLVHETRGRTGAPSGLELGFATPRAWLAAGKRIRVRAMPTSFGPISYTINSAARWLRVEIQVPERAAPRSLRLRLRLPASRRIGRILIGGRERPLGAGGETIDLTGLRGRVELVARVRG